MEYNNMDIVDDEVKGIRLTSIFNLMKEDREISLPNYFKKKKVIVTKNVFPPDYGEGTELLLNYISEHSTVIKDKQVLDLGTGSGVIGIHAAQTGADVLSLDFSQYALDCAIKNANNILSQQNRKKIQIESSMLFSYLLNNNERKFDYIFFNPPFIDTSWHIRALANSDKEPESKFINSIFDPQGDTLLLFLKEAKKYLTDDGKIVLAYSLHEPLTRVANMINDSGYDIVFVKALTKEVVKGKKNLIFYSIELKTTKNIKSLDCRTKLGKFFETFDQKDVSASPIQLFEPIGIFQNDFEVFMSAFIERIALAKKYIKIYSLFPIPGMFMPDSKFEKNILNALNNSNVNIIHAFASDEVLTKNLVYFSNKKDKEFLLNQLLKLRDYRKALSQFGNNYFPFRIESVPFFIVIIDGQFAMMGFINMKSKSPKNWLKSGFETINPAQVMTIEGIFDNFVFNPIGNENSSFNDTYDPSYIKDFKTLRNFEFEEAILDNELSMNKRRITRKYL